MSRQSHGIGHLRPFRFGWLGYALGFNLGLDKMGAASQAKNTDIHTVAVWLRPCDEFRDFGRFSLGLCARSSVRVL